MLKRSIAVAGAVAVLGGMNTPGARATEEAADAISGVTLDWADAEHTNVKITWTESAEVANTLTVTSTDPNQAATVFGSTLAGDQNAFVIDSASLGSSSNPAVKRRIVVAGAEAADQAQSAEFDTYTYTPTSLTLSFTTDNKVRWTLPADTRTDGTPNDKLDFPAAYRYPVQQRIESDPAGTAECNVVEVEPTTAATGVVPNPGKPFNLSVNTDNEWGTARGPVATVETTAGLTIGGPTVTQYGTTTPITGQVTRTIVAESGAPTVCDEQSVPAPNVPVVLQQRTSSTAAWTTIGTVSTDATGKYTAVATNTGGTPPRTQKLAHALWASPEPGRIEPV